MSVLCLVASLETLRPLCYRDTHLLQEVLCSCFHEGSLQTVQVIVTLSARHVLQNNTQFIAREVKVWTSRRSILGAENSSPTNPELSWLLGRN